MFSISLPFLEDFDEVDEIDEERETEGSSASLVNPQERRRDNLEAFGIVGRGGTSSEASLWSRCGEDALLGSTGPSSEERALDVNVLGTSGLELIRDGLYLCLLSSSLSLCRCLSLLFNQAAHTGISPPCCLPSIHPHRPPRFSSFPVA